MTLDLGRFGIWRRWNEITPDQAREAESLGYGAIWLGASPKADLTAVEELIAVTGRIPVVTGVVNMWREDPDIVAASYHRIDGRHPYRFLLGVGVGHPEATAEYQRPLAKIGEYLDRLDRAGVPAERRILAALGPRVLMVAAERTAGAHPYLTSPRHTAFAREVLGEGPILAPDQAVVDATAPAEARAIARTMVARYLGLSNYRANLLREGWDDSDFDHGGSDRLIDALFLYGSPERIAAGLVAHLEAGADHVGVFVLGDAPVDSWRRLAQVLL